jgi:hypothetical protein
MVEVCESGQWWLVAKDGEELAWFACTLDANRFAIAMLHDGLADAVTLPNGLEIT